MPGAIDIVINLHTLEVFPLKPKWRREFFEGKIGADAEIINGLPICGLGPTDGFDWRTVS
jgi:hypothetical protein